MKQQKSTFNSYNLILDVILIQNVVNMFLIAQSLRFTCTIKMSAQEYVHVIEVKKNLFCLISRVVDVY